MKNKIDMCNGAIAPKMLLFAVPLMISSILQLLFNAADLVVVAQYATDDSYAAVGSTGSLVNLMTNLFIGLSVGVNVLAARYLGSKEDTELEKTVHTSVLISLLIGCVLAVFGVFTAPIFLKFMHLQGNILKLASLYMQIYFLGMPSVMLYNFGSAILRANGDTRRPMYFMVISGVVNICFNLIFVICFSMDVAGVAVATVISQTLSAVLVLLTLMKDKGPLKLNLKKLRIDKKILLKIMQIGLPAGLQGTLFSLSNVFIQSSVNTFGNDVIAGNSSAIQIEGFVYVAMNAFHQASLSFTSQNVGAGKKERILKITFVSLILVTVTGLLLGNAAVLFGKPLLHIFTEKEAIINAGLVRLKIICSIYFLCGLMDVMVGVLRGLGYSTMPAIVSLMGACVLRLIWLATVFKIEYWHKIETVYYSYPISWIITFSVHVLCFIVVYRKYMKKNTVLPSHNL